MIEDQLERLIGAMNQLATAGTNAALALAQQAETIHAIERRLNRLDAKTSALDEYVAPGRMEEQRSLPPPPEPTPAPAPQAAPAPTSGALTLDDVRAAGKRLMSAEGGTKGWAEVRAAFGIKQVSELTAEQYGPMIEAVEKKLRGGGA